VNKTNPTPTVPRSRLDGDGLLGMFLSALHLLERNVDKINALNVFPVPDGDTGTNMYLTLRSVVEDSRPLQGATSAAVSRKMADVALMEAKGNSGVILSQFFRGIAIGLEGTADFGCLELAQSLAEGRKLAYTAIGNPVEGTILTVMTSVAEAADAMDSSTAQLSEMLDAICIGAREAVALTPTMLPVLMQAGVVDAGGQGLSVILEGVRRYVDGSSPVDEEMELPVPVGIDGHAGSVSHEFLAATEEEQYGYCTQLLVEGEELDPASIRETMSSLGVSAVVVGTESTVRVHVHVPDPGPVLSAAVALGVVSQVKIENMDSQHVEFSAAHRQDPVVQPLESAVVTVVRGKGFEAVVNSLGVSEIVQGGDTMNPSVKDLLEAVGRAPSEQVILLPNNRNIIPAARQAVKLSDKSVTVVASETIPQGIGALLSFSPNRDSATNVAEMEEEAGSVRTGEVTRAVREVELNGIAVKEGSLIGLLERVLVSTGTNIEDVLGALLHQAELAEGDLVTFYYGDEITADEAAAAATKLGASFEGVEFEVVDGGQPHYPFIVSIE
jgi:hypothetical protein